LHVVTEWYCVVQASADFSPAADDVSHRTEEELPVEDKGASTDNAENVGQFLGTLFPQMLQVKLCTGDTSISVSTGL